MLIHPSVKPQQHRGRGVAVQPFHRYAGCRHDFPAILSTALPFGGRPRWRGHLSTVDHPSVPDGDDLRSVLADIDHDHRPLTLQLQARQGSLHRRARRHQPIRLKPTVADGIQVLAQLPTSNPGHEHRGIPVLARFDYLVIVCYVPSRVRHKTVRLEADHLADLVRIRRGQGDVAQVQESPRDTGPDGGTAKRLALFLPHISRKRVLGQPGQSDAFAVEACKHEATGLTGVIQQQELAASPAKGGQLVQKFSHHLSDSLVHKRQLSRHATMRTFPDSWSRTTTARTVFVTSPARTLARHKMLNTSEVTLHVLLRTADSYSVMP